MKPLKDIIYINKNPFTGPVLSRIIELLVVASNQLRSAGAGRFLVYPLLGEALENKQLPSLRHANLVRVWIHAVSPRLQSLNGRLIVRKLADGELLGTAISIDLVGQAGDNGVRRGPQNHRAAENLAVLSHLLTQVPTIHVQGDPHL